MISKRIFFPIICLVVITLVVSSIALIFYPKRAENIDRVTIAILGKNMSHTLPAYLSSIEEQTWPKEKTYLYIRTYDNTDDTSELLKEWIEKTGKAYAGFYFDDKSITKELDQHNPLEGEALQFKIQGKIKQDSVDWARAHQSHYFVVGGNNFIVPETIEKALEVNLPIVAPLLRTTATVYSNFYSAVDSHGYFLNSPHYFTILNREMTGLSQQPVVHGTYLIRHHVLDQIVYDDNSKRYEFVIFSDNARKKTIPQYLDNRQLYGRITLAQSKEEFEKEPWRTEFLEPTGKPSISLK